LLRHKKDPFRHQKPMLRHDLHMPLHDGHMLLHERQLLLQVRQLPLQAEHLLVQARRMLAHDKQLLQHEMQKLGHVMALILHKGDEPVLVGVARVVSDPYPDPDQGDPTIQVFDLEPVERLEHEIPLSALLDDPDFQDWELIANPDLDVAEIPAPLWDRLIAMSHEGLAQVARDRV
jgi:EVE domain-containing protein